MRPTKPRKTSKICLTTFWPSSSARKNSLCFTTSTISTTSRDASSARPDESASASRSERDTAVSWFKKQIWFRYAPPLRVFKCTKGILLVTGNSDVSGHVIQRLWLYDGKHFRPADQPTNDFYDLV